MPRNIMNTETEIQMRNRCCTHSIIVSAVELTEIYCNNSYLKVITNNSEYCTKRDNPKYLTFWYGVIRQKSTQCDSD